jgi:Helicase conserved C-terminal domain
MAEDAVAADDERAPVPALDEAAAFQRDLYLYWREVGRMGGLPLTSRGYVTRQALRQLRAVLAVAGQLPAPPADPGEVEEPRLYFLRRLLERLRLVRPAPAAPRLHAADPAELARYVALPLAARLRLAARLWVAGAWWPERPDPSVAPAGVMAPAPPRVALARRRALDAVAAASIGMPVALPSAQQPEPRQPPANRARAARRAAGRTAATLTPQAPGLLDPLVWLGIVTSPGPRGGFVAGVAAAALRAGDDPPDLGEEHGPVAVLPNLTVIAYPPLTAPALWLLDTCADETALQQAATYALTAGGVVRARRHGLDAAALASRLEALTGKPLPTNVRTTLEDWERRAARIQLTPAASILEVRDAALLDALFADPGAAAWRDRRLAPTVALLKPDGAESAREWLLRRGQLPARIAPAGDASREA